PDADRSPSRRRPRRRRGPCTCSAPRGARGWRGLGVAPTLFGGQASTLLRRTRRARDHRAVFALCRGRRRRDAVLRLLGALDRRLGLERRHAGRRSIARLSVGRDRDELVLVRHPLAGGRTLIPDPVGVEAGDLVLGATG